jgi:hypothetical protein
MARWFLEHGSYYLKDPDEKIGLLGPRILMMCDQVAVAWSKQEHCILKHGSPESVKEWLRKKHHEVEPLFPDVVIVTFPPKFDPEEINRAVESGWYLEKLLERLEKDDGGRNG